MKITDVTLTLFAWDDIPPTQYGQHSKFAGSSALGLLRIATDDGVEGNAFLGSASNGATTDGQGLISHLKPVLMGRNANHREAMAFHWYEDPLADQDIYNYVKLKQQLSIPILATEYPITGLDSYQPWIMLQATDFLRGDVAVKGGITTLVKGAHLAESFRMNYEVHHGGNSLNNVANLHVIASIRNTEFFEVLLPDGAQKDGLEHDITVGRDGLVHVPNGPGLGAAIDFKLIDGKKVPVLA